MTSPRLLAALACVALVACQGTSSEPSTSLAIRARSTEQAIQGGTLDTTSSNVVGIIIDTGQGVAICTGALIAPNLVLTAHHCVADVGSVQNCGNSFGTLFPPNSFYVTTLGSGPSSVFNGTTSPTIDNVSWFGVSAVDAPGSNVCGQDIAILRLSASVPSVTPLIPRVDSPVTVGEAYTAVGYGAMGPSITQSCTATSQCPANYTCEQVSQTARNCEPKSGTRYSLASTLSVACAANCGAGLGGTNEWVGWSGSQSIQKGTCEGDSGGPALDSQRRVIGTVSRGPAGACNETVYEAVGDTTTSTWIKCMATRAATAGNYTAPSWVGTGDPCANISMPPVVTCPTGQMCADASGMGNYECLANTGGVPAGAPTCSQTTACATGYTCFQTSPNSTTGVCLKDCTATGTGGGAGGGTGTGGGAGTGGGGGMTPVRGSCSVATMYCVSVGSSFQCADPSTSNGVPANAPTCSATIACPSAFTCFALTQGATTGVCLEDCTTTPGTGGGAGGGTATGGGSAGTGGGTAGTGGGAAGTGGGTAGMGGGAGTGGGTGTGAGTGTGNPMFNLPGLPETPKKTGCSCTEVPTDALMLVLSGLMFVRARRRRS